MTLVRLERLSKIYPGGLEALRDISLSVEPGSFTALLGPSGSGKSTLLRLIAGLAQPTSGGVVWESERPRLGVVFQDPTLMPWASLLGNVALPLELRGDSRDSARAAARAMLAKVGLDGFSEAYPAQLSGGMRMRAALARALVGEPNLLLLDEPFAALDEIARGTLNADLLALWQERRPAILFITHSLTEAVFLSERIHILSPRPGRLAATLDVHLPYPRDDALRLTTPFLDHVHEAGAALRRAMGKP